MAKSFRKGLDSLIENTSVSTEPDFFENEKEAEKAQTITIPVSLKRQIKKYCADHDMTIKDLFIRSVKRFMKVDDN